MQRVVHINGEDVKPKKDLSKWWSALWPSRKKIEVTFETKRTLKIRRTNSRLDRYCLDCGKDSVLLTFEEAKDVFHGELAILESLLGGGQIHQKEMKSGQVQICFNSLKDEIERLPNGDSQYSDPEIKT